MTEEIVNCEALKRMGHAWVLTEEGQGNVIEAFWEGGAWKQSISKTVHHGP